MGRDAILKLFTDAGFGTEAFGQLRCVITCANRQPAVAVYVLQSGDPTYRPVALDILQIEEGLVTEIATFGPEVFPAFALPLTMDPEGGGQQHLTNSGDSVFLSWQGHGCMHNQTMKLIAALLLVVAMIPSAWGQQLLLPDNAARDEAALTRAFADFAAASCRQRRLAADAGASFCCNWRPVRTGTPSRPPRPGANNFPRARAPILPSGSSSTLAPRRRRPEGLSIQSGHSGKPFPN